MKTIKSDAKLINKSDIQKAIHMRGPVGWVIASCAMSLMGLNKINRVYSSVSEFKGVDFTKAILKERNIKTHILPEELENIPAEGPFIVVSNHPFGGWDGIVLYNAVAARRKDFKVVVNFILSLIPNLKDDFLDVNPFSENKKLKSNVTGLKAAYKTIADGGCLGIFPAGEVSTYYHGRKYTADKDWTGGVLRLIQSCGVPVVPVYFDGTNSRWFHFVGKIHPLLRTVNLPRELLKRKDTTIIMRIGKPLMAKEVAAAQSPSALGDILRNRVYAQEANILCKDEETPGTADTSVPQKPLIPAADPKRLEMEMNELTPLFELGKYVCYLADTESIPVMIRELGRCREESFRQVGEGTGKPCDIDEYDKYYKHLLLWDKEALQLAGAYRLGIGSEIMEKYGVDGFYTHTLFEYSDEFRKILPSSIELGRSFLSVEYKKEALPLMLLIKGLFFSMLKYENCRYLFGPASITSWLPLFYRSLIVYWFSQQLEADIRYKGLVTPRTPFEPDFLRTDPQILLQGKMENIDAFDKYIQRLSGNRLRIPTLIKKYVKLNARMLAFNVDKDFNYCVDGMVLLNLHNVPREEVEMLIKGSDDKDELMAKFYGTGS